MASITIERVVNTLGQAREKFSTGRKGAGVLRSTAAFRSGPGGLDGPIYAPLL
ncbi:MAG: hypothetical protein V1800_10545 [Candidatus Latescibacterota bacterium]